MLKPIENSVKLVCLKPKGVFWRKLNFHFLFISILVNTTLIWKLKIFKNISHTFRDITCFRHAGHCWRSRDELISDVLLWTPTHGRAKTGRPARTYIQQLCEDTGCCPEDLPEEMNDRKKVAREGQGYPCFQHDMMMMMMTCFLNDYAFTQPFTMNKMWHKVNFLVELSFSEMWHKVSFLVELSFSEMWHKVSFLVELSFSEMWHKVSFLVELSFSENGCYTSVRESSLLYLIHSWRENSCMHTFLKGISSIQDRNSHFYNIGLLSLFPTDINIRLQVSP